jgi:hypothetical protein
MSIPTERKTKMTARQEVVNEFINSSRHDVIYYELQRDFFKHLKEKVNKGEISLDAIDRYCPRASSNEGLPLNESAEAAIDDMVTQYDGAYQVALVKLNFFKGLRKQDQDKNAVKMAEKLKGLVPQEIHVDIVDEK